MNRKLKTGHGMLTIGLFVVGAILLVLFDSPWTIAGGIALLIAETISGIGLIASPFTAMLTSRVDVGDWFARHGLFAVPNGTSATAQATLVGEEPLPAAGHLAGTTAMARAFVARPIGPAVRP